jgi:hypothetical protein
MYGVPGYSTRVYLFLNNIRIAPIIILVFFYIFFFPMRKFRFCDACDCPSLFSKSAICAICAIFAICTICAICVIVRLCDCAIRV